MAVDGTLGLMGGEGTLGSMAGRSCGSVGGSVVVEVFVVELKRVARWSKCFLVSVSSGGRSVEWDLERRAAVRSLAAAAITSSGVADGILQWCGNQRTVWAMRVRLVEGSQTL